jgi:tRNA threonylcarbamoyladenosine biosynthesis protein TsaB
LGFLVITLSIDTSEARGSVALRRDGATVEVKRHEDGSDYSAWLLPAIVDLLSHSELKIEQVDLLAVSTGPGSFTGLRVGVTSTKALAEVYGTRVVGVSRLEAIAMSEQTATAYVASCYDAQRGQLFGALYRSSNNILARIGDEFVISPDEFIEFVDGQVSQESVTWVTLDLAIIEKVEKLRIRAARGDKLVEGNPELASVLGELAEERAKEGKYSDPVTLDANYVRRSDAEIFWKGALAGGR